MKIPTKKNRKRQQRKKPKTRACREPRNQTATVVTKRGVTIVGKGVSSINAKMMRQ